ncbi:MAG: undecaprenyl diphosphate synthase family protein, partial [Flavobacteriales bacterium]|nr:undecaprenyl diphosphate synthase family protein [Flavobacteriales bacterium]
NYLLWQIAYAELHFSPVLWPDFSKADLYRAVIDYQQRERRFGKISEQVSPAS